MLVFRVAWNYQTHNSFEYYNSFKFNEWRRVASSRSGPLSLNSNETYLLRGIMKEQGGGDFLKVCRAFSVNECTMYIGVYILYVSMYYVCLFISSSLEVLYCCRSGFSCQTHSICIMSPNRLLGKGMM